MEIYISYWNRHSIQMSCKLTVNELYDGDAINTREIINFGH